MKAFFKSITLLALIWLGVTNMIGCGDDDDGAETFLEADLVGTWELSSVELDYAIGDRTLVQFLRDELGISEVAALLLIEGFEQQLSDGFETGGTITFDADNTYEADLDGDMETGSWSLAANGVTIMLDPDNSPEDVELTITTLTDTRLIMVLNEMEEFDADSDGQADEISIEATLDLTRQ